MQPARAETRQLAKTSRSTGLIRSMSSPQQSGRESSGPVRTVALRVPCGARVADRAVGPNTHLIDRARTVAVAVVYDGQVLLAHAERPGGAAEAGDDLIAGHAGLDRCEVVLRHRRHRADRGAAGQREESNGEFDS